MKWRALDEDRWIARDGARRLGVVQRFNRGWFWSTPRDPHWHQAASRADAERAVASTSEGA